MFDIYFANRRVLASGAVLAAALLVPDHAVSAQELSALVGKHVIVVAERAQLRNGPQAPKIVPAGMMLDVVRVQGDWLWVNRGWIHRRDVVAYDQALDFFDRQIESRPTAQAYSHRARVQCYHGEFALALADGDAAVRLDPKLASAWCNRGRAHAGLERVDEAIADFSQAIELNPDLSTAYSHRGRAWTEKGEYTRALADCNAAIRLDPRSSVAYYYRGRARHRQGEAEHAIADFTQAIRLNPHYVPAYNHRGLVYAQRREYGRAIADYDAAVRLDPRFDVVHLHYNRGNAWLGLGNHRRALADYRVALRRAGNYLPAVEAMAACYAHQGEFETAAKWQRRAVELAGGEQKSQLVSALTEYQHALAAREESGDSQPE